MNEEVELRLERQRLEQVYSDLPFTQPDKRAQVAALLDEVGKDQAQAEAERREYLAERRERRVS